MNEFQQGICYISCAFGHRRLWHAWKSVLISMYTTVESKNTVYKKSHALKFIQIRRSHSKHINWSLSRKQMKTNQQILYSMNNERWDNWKSKEQNGIYVYNLDRSRAHFSSLYKIWLIQIHSFFRHSTINAFSVD